MLVVEDDAPSREALERLFAHFGARAVGAASVEEGLRCFEREPPALVVSDIELPGADGYSLIRRIRDRDARGGCRRTPAIALNGYHPPTAQAAARHAGFDEFLAKPVDIDVFLARVRSLLA